MQCRAKLKTVNRWANGYYCQVEGRHFLVLDDAELIDSDLANNLVIDGFVEIEPETIYLLWGGGQLPQGDFHVYGGKMVCLDCGWKGDIWELIPQEGDEYGNECCPECRSNNVIDSDEMRELEIESAAQLEEDIESHKTEQLSGLL